jgi:hypothetical protein
MKLRLRDLEGISKNDEIEGLTILKEVVGLKKTWFFKKMLFRIAVKKASKLITEARGFDLNTIEYTEDCKIKKPQHIDNISFRAMTTLHSKIGSANTDYMSDLISEIISTACFQENREGDFDSGSAEYIAFKKQVLDSPLFHMMGLFNWICNAVDDSQKTWRKRFMSVEVPNPDLKEAGIHRMSQFNVLVTIKTICADFNVGFNEAWQMSYALTQTNSYSKATYDHIHENLRMLKETKMKMNKNASH